MRILDVNGAGSASSHNPAYTRFCLLSHFESSIVQTETVQVLTFANFGPSFFETQSQFLIRPYSAKRWYLRLAGSQGHYSSAFRTTKQRQLLLKKKKTIPTRITLAAAAASQWSATIQNTVRAGYSHWTGSWRNTRIRVRPSNACTCRSPVHDDHNYTTSDVMLRAVYRRHTCWRNHRDFFRNNPTTLALPVAEKQQCW